MASGTGRKSEVTMSYIVKGGSFISDENRVRVKLDFANRDES